ncbi:MAG: hypothetical protein ACOC4F_02660, partial [bacterium]
MCRFKRRSAPEIGITTGNALLSPSYLAVWFAVRLAGGRPVRLRLRPVGRSLVRSLLRHIRTPGSPGEERVPPALGTGSPFSNGSIELAGVIISGGPHVHPQLYEAPSAVGGHDGRPMNFVARARVLIGRRAALRDIA